MNELVALLDADAPPLLCWCFDLAHSA